MSDSKDKEAPTVPVVLSMMGVQTAVFFALGLLIWWLSGRPISDFVTFSTLQIGQGIAVGAAFTAIAAGIFFGFPRISDYLVSAQKPSLDFLKSKLGFAPIVIISIFAGIGEEALFRGGIQSALGDYLGVPIAVILASALFAAIHFSKPIIMFLQFLIGCSFGVIYWYTGSLLAVMIGHGLYDVFALYYVQRELHRLGIFDQPPGTAAGTDVEQS